MVTISGNTQLNNLVNQRWRTRAEQCLGMIALSDEVIRRMAGAKLTNFDATGQIDDGVAGQADFTVEHYDAFFGLFQGVRQIGENAQIMAALHALQVRSIGVITPQLPEVQPGLDPLASALRYIVRPLAPQIRAMFAQINDDEPITSTTLVGLDDADLIDDGRGAEMLAPVPVGAVRAINAMLQQLAGPGTSDALARAIDAACCTPLEVR